MQPATKQDVQGAIDNARDRIVNRMLSRNDLQNNLEHLRVKLLDNFQDLYRIQEFWQQNQQIIRQASLNQDVINKRMNSVEIRLSVIDQDVKTIKQLIYKVLENQRTMDQTMTIMPAKLYNMPVSELEQRTRTRSRGA